MTVDSGPVDAGPRHDVGDVSRPASPERPRSRFALGVSDLLQGFGNWRLTHLVGLGDIRKRYARSRIGQFWITLSTGIMIVAMGAVWSVLWKMQVADLMPFLAVSLVLWTLITGTLTEAATIFVATGPLFLNQRVSFSTAIYALIYRHFIIFLHNVPIVIVTMLVFPRPAGFVALLAVPGLLLLVVTLVWTAYLVAIACLRFRDVTQVVQSGLMVIFFITPVMWKPDQIPPDKQYLLLFNPFADLLEVARDPLFGRVPDMTVWAAAALFALGGLVLALPLIGHCQRRIVYWI